jgi:hypothetical protein
MKSQKVAIFTVHHATKGRQTKGEGLARIDRDKRRRGAHRNFLLGDDAYAVLAAHADRRDPHRLHRLEGILCAQRTARVRRLPDLSKREKQKGLGFWSRGVHAPTW